MYFIIKILPKNLVSFITGIIVSLDRPKFFARFLCNMFIKIYKINLNEAEDLKFDSLQELFTRKLKLGARNITGSLCSPADGFLSQIDKINNNKLIQAKGICYSANEFLCDEINDELSSYYTIYLAPYNYHRVHSPVSGTVKSIQHVSGTLWPVNKKFTRLVPNLFIKNERVIFEIQTPDGGKVFVVMVGALNVGKIDISVFEEDTVTIGDEIGVFMLGSTVVVILDHTAMQNINFDMNLVNKPIRLGQKIHL